MKRAARRAALAALAVLMCATVALMLAVDGALGPTYLYLTNWGLLALTVHTVGEAVLCDSDRLVAWRAALRGLVLPLAIEIAVGYWPVGVDTGTAVQTAQAVLKHGVNAAVAVLLAVGAGYKRRRWHALRVGVSHPRLTAALACAFFGAYFAVNVAVSYTTHAPFVYAATVAALFDGAEPEWAQIVVMVLATVVLFAPCVLLVIGIETLSNAVRPVVPRRAPSGAGWRVLDDAADTARALAA